MTTSRVSPRARRRPLGAAAIFCLFFLASCRAILGTDNYQSTVDLLCDLLARCYDDDGAACREITTNELTYAEAGVRQKWLETFSERDCHSRCASARRCLDTPPVCSFDACGRREDCCGFVAGQKDCNLIEKSCCTRRGVRCKDDSDCCPGAGTCTNDVCGGVACGIVNEPCLVGAQCCTGVCKNGKCSDDICFDDGFECDANEDCCKNFCDRSSGKGKCGKTCGLEQAKCGADAPCCGELVCRSGTCSNPDCFSDGVECSGNDQCCGKRCDFDLDACVACKEAAAACEGSGECCSGLCKNGACVDCLAKGDACPVDGKECCSGVCKDGACAPACGEVGCSHDVCVIGPPLSATTCVDDPCVALVCAEDKYCCCEEWDSVCVSEAIALCGNPCE